MEAWGLTDTGNVREENQDFYRMERLGPETLLAVVCDGMGGARAGNVASRLACEVFCGEVCRSLRDGMTEAEEQDVLCTAAKLANISVYEHAQLSEEFRGMGEHVFRSRCQLLRLAGQQIAHHLRQELGEFDLHHPSTEKPNPAALIPHQNRNPPVVLKSERSLEIGRAHV